MDAASGVEAEAILRPTIDDDPIDQFNELPPLFYTHQKTVTAIPSIDIHKKLQEFDRVMNDFFDLADGCKPAQRDVDICPPTKEWRLTSACATWRFSFQTSSSASKKIASTQCTSSSTHRRGCEQQREKIFLQTARTKDFNTGYNYYRVLTNAKTWSSSTRRR